jgi:predicted TIM-barrel enzyme
LEEEESNRAMTHPARERLVACTKAQKPIVVAGIGSGLTARGAAMGQADVLAVYNTAIFRIRNLPSILAFLPGDDPNELTCAVASEVVANAGECPVLVGFAPHNPQIRFDRLIDRTIALGGAGVTNEPFVGLYGASFRGELERAGCGFSREVEFLEAAGRRGLMTLGWACNPEEARRMAGAGVDTIGLMLGITNCDGEGLEEAIDRTHTMGRAALGERNDALLLVHGGCLDRPERVSAVLAACPVYGYVTGSSVERDPILDKVAESVAGFKRVAMQKR